MTSTLTHTPTPALTALVDGLDDAVRAPRCGLDVPHAVGEALRPFLGRPGLVTPEQEAGDPRRYRTHLLHVPDDGAYSLVAAVWRPGQRTPIHDHIAWCVVGVHRGVEHEIRYRLVDDHPLARRLVKLFRGEEKEFKKEFKKGGEKGAS